MSSESLQRRAEELQSKGLSLSHSQRAAARRRLKQRAPLDPLEAEFVFGHSAITQQRKAAAVGVAVGV